MKEREALKKMYQLLLTEPHAPTVCEQLERIAREALAQPEQEPVALVVRTAPERIWLDLGFDPSDEDEISFNDLVDTTWSDDNATGYGIEYVRADTTPPQPQPEQEPAFWYSAQEDEFMTYKTRKEHERLNSYTHKVGKFDLALYTTQPQRKPLTDEEIKRMAAKWFLSMYWPICNTFAREIEAAHGIK